MIIYLDSDHDGEKKTGMHRSGLFIYINIDLIRWFSKRQYTIKASVFGVESMAMKFGMESLQGLQHKLRMMVVEIYGPQNIYGNDMSVIKNTQCLSSQLKN